MSEPQRICLNMIVKNETANLERCLSAVAPYIDCWVIGDTGSTDGTQNFIESFFAARNLPGELRSFPFINFEQARNAALDCAYASPLQFDYLLFDDADMELVVENGDFRQALKAPGYRLLQRANGGLAYWNTRLARRDVGARYHGVTHEYVDVPGGVEALHGVWYKDHASGANRVDKFERDIRLLKGALEKEPENHRYWFYLAQSYRDAGRLDEAAKAYAKRAEMGGWDEEAWNARLQQARCLKRLGDEGGFLREALAAFNQRPQRAEPLYDLARHYREKGMNDASALFSEAGIGMGRPEGDVLFIEDFVYTAGLKEEYSIAANYSRDPQRKDRGFAACNWLALSREAPDHSRHLALSNLDFYPEPAAKTLPSFVAQRIEFVPPAGYRATNPSIARAGDELVIAQRTVNYAIDDSAPEGDIRRYPTTDGGPIHTRNFLLRLGRDFAVRSAKEILPPAGLPEPAWPYVTGFEDVRLFAWRGDLWGVACFRERTPEGWCEQVLARIEDQDAEACRLTDWRVLRPEGPQLHEKNWMPRVVDDRLQFIYLCDPTRVIDDQARTIVETKPAIVADQFRGGSQAIAFDGGWLALIHEARVRGKTRLYRHRFVWLDNAGRLSRVSRPFYFQKNGIEFAAGLCWHPDGKRLVMSFGVEDSEAWIATADPADVRIFLDDVDRLPFGAPPAAAMAFERLAPLDAPGKAAANSDRLSEAADEGRAPRSVAEIFLDLAPFLSAADSPVERRELSRAFDRRIAPHLDLRNDDALPQIHCFYEVRDDKAEHKILIAAVSSMRAAGHPVRVWTYSPQKLEFLQPCGVELGAAADVVPRALFERIVGGSEIRYFSDVFRYAALYEHGGLWMDADVILLRPFAFRGDYFFNLQWRSGVQNEHFVCGNVLYAKPHSRHMRALYEMAIDRFFSPQGWTFGAVGPILLSNYIASEAGAELRDWVFSPMFFNAIDWTEVDRFDRPLAELKDYLNDERVFGLHLWTARNPARASGDHAPLIALLADPAANLPRFADLADRFNTDKNRHTGNRHAYARIYERLLGGRRLSMRRLMEIMQRRSPTGGALDRAAESASLWQAYFPFCHLTTVDLATFAGSSDDRRSSLACDQTNIEELQSLAAAFDAGYFDAIIDDGSHVSSDQQRTLVNLFPLLAEGGWYFIEDLDWQPPGEDATKTTQTKILLRNLHVPRSTPCLDPHGVGSLAGQFAEILFFDSHYELSRAKLMGGLVAIRKQGGAGFLR